MNFYKPHYIQVCVCVCVHKDLRCFLFTWRTQIVITDCAYYRSFRQGKETEMASNDWRRHRGGDKNGSDFKVLGSICSGSTCSTWQTLKPKILFKAMK